MTKKTVNELFNDYVGYLVEKGIDKPIDEKLTNIYVYAARLEERNIELEEKLKSLTIKKNVRISDLRRGDRVKIIPKKSVVDTLSDHYKEILKKSVYTMTDNYNYNTKYFYVNRPISVYNKTKAYFEFLKKDFTLKLVEE